MISDDEIRNLPGDPKLAFAKYVSLLRESLIQNTMNFGRNDDQRPVHQEYMANVKAAVEHYRIPLNVEYDYESDQEFWDQFREISSTLDYLIAKIRLEGLHGGASIDHNFVELSDDYRSQIHGHLNKVRRIVNAVDIEEHLRKNIWG